MTTKVPAAELADRLNRFQARMDAEQPQWALGAILGRVNQYYFTGTMQDAVLLIPRGGAPVLWVRRSFERACAESLLPDIRPMSSFREAAQSLGAIPETIHIEAEVVPYGLLQRFRKHFPCREVAALDLQVARIRAVKSPYELALMERAGAIHQRIMEEQVPTLLREGMSEAEFGCDLFSAMMREGHQGLVRFGMFGVETVVGQIGFGENSLCPTNVDSPGGFLGLGPAAPVLGSPHRKLRRGDLVFLDIGCGVEGYQTDKTLTYAFGQTVSKEAVAVHQRCVEIELRAAAMLKPGAIPSEIYATILNSLDDAFRDQFMGYGNRRVHFLGHGIGLQIDELPVIAKGFDEPLVEGMVIALEPKKGVAGVGMVGSENTYRVTPAGGKSLTGNHPGLMLVERTRTE
ncbi:MAG TPA: Xaa-Pro peptidase family protein [Candidatus Sulfotelmatobacter sp.]|nr:Xaa-Pro peptidase family protein [Candidatus Sulfotelmatobacter sp.]